MTSFIQTAFFGSIIFYVISPLLSDSMYQWFT